MATANTTANTAPQTLFTVPTPQKAHLGNVDIDNEGSSGAVIVQLTDTFTPAASIGNTSPYQMVITRFQATVPQGVSFSADVLSLKDVDFIGVVSAGASAIEAGCAIIVGYSLE